MKFSKEWLLKQNSTYQDNKFIINKILIGFSLIWISIIINIKYII